MNVYKVELENVRKELKKLPKYVVSKLNLWVSEVEEHGMPEVRKVPGYHDEPLKGKRAGQRSIRLTKGYRAIYIEENDGTLTVVTVEEIHKHDY